MKKKVFVRFPNESEFLEIMMDMDDFKPEKEFNDVVFGWYGDVYICLKK